MYLSEAFHVVHIKSHHVSEAVREEHGVCAGCYCLIGIALHESELFQAYSHVAAYCEVDIEVSHSWLRGVEGEVVTLVDDIVYLFLPLCEASVHGHGAGVV